MTIRHRFLTLALTSGFLLATAAYSVEPKPAEVRSFELKYFGLVDSGENVKVEVKSAFVLIDESQGKTVQSSGVTEKHFSEEMVDFRAESDDRLSWAFGSEATPRPSTGAFVFHYPQALRMVPGRVAMIFFVVSVTDTRAGKPPRTRTNTFPLRLRETGAPPRCLRIVREPEVIVTELQPTCSGGAAWWNRPLTKP